MHRLLLVSNSTVTRLGVQALVTSDFEIESVEVPVATGHVFARVERERFDLIVIDGDFGPDRSIDLCLAANREWPSVPIMVLASTPEEEFARSVIEAGARGYVCKDADPRDLQSSVDWLLKGQAVLDPRVTGSVLAWIVQVEGVTSRDDLSFRELEVLRLVSKGEPNKRIARQLGIGENTVKTYLRRAYSKLGCRTRSAASAEAARRGWI